MMSRFSRWLLFAVLLLFAFGWAVAPAQAGERTPRTKSAHLSSGYPADVSLGKGGVYLVPNYETYITLQRLDLRKRAYAAIKAPGGDMEFTRPQPMRVVMLDRYGHLFGSEDIPRAPGLVQVYFNLTNAERKAWNDGTLSIYLHKKGATWVECSNAYLEDGENKPNGRLICILSASSGTFNLITK